MPTHNVRRLVFQPETYSGLQRGINQIVDAVRPTLGPLARTVAIAPIVGKSTPELLDNGGVIARRIIQLPDRDDDVGAMLTRQMLWQLQDDVGDGTATAAVLFQSIFNQGVRTVAAGGSPVHLGSALEKGLRVILDELDSMTIPIEGKESLTGVARSISHDAQIAEELAEIFDIIGEYGHLEVQSGRSREHKQDYLNGSYWMHSGVFSGSMLAAGSIQLEKAAILISDLEIDDPYQLAPMMRAALQAGSRTLVIVARSLSEKVIGFLLTNKQTDKFHAIAVKTPGLKVEDQVFALEDLSILTGGRPLVKAAGQTLDYLKSDDLGWARAIWATNANLGILGGKGDPRRLRQQIATMRASFSGIEDAAQRKKIQQRIGRLMGGSATLRIGGATDTEIKFRKDVAQRTSEALRRALMDGVLPGGGQALLACHSKLQRLYDDAVDDERAAYRILMQALREPFRVILANAGYDPAEIQAEMKDGCGFDVESGRVVDMAQAGIYDVAAVQKAAVKAAVLTASLALTIDVMAHRKRQREARAPHQDAK
jgi:chaperonin GroEL